MPYWRAFYHLVWSTKKREPLLGPTEQALVRRSFQLSFEDLDTIPHAVGFMPDHVHVVVSFPPKVSAAELVQRLKGASTHAINHRSEAPRPDRFSWQGEYGFLTFSEQALQRVITYVETQPERHARNQLWPSLERDLPDPADR